MEEQEMVITSTTNNVDNGDIRKKKKNDRKIRTAQGLRDRRVRLSIGIARKFFDLQDTLGFDKASQTLDWLFTKSNLPASDNNVDDEHVATTSSGSGTQQEAEQAKSNLRKESREKARERARSRTRAKQDQQLLLHYMSTTAACQNSVWDNIATTTGTASSNHNNYATDGRVQFGCGKPRWESETTHNN